MYLVKFRYLQLIAVSGIVLLFLMTYVGLEKRKIFEQKPNKKVKRMTQISLRQQTVFERTISHWNINNAKLSTHRVDMNKHLYVNKTAKTTNLMPEIIRDQTTMERDPKDFANAEKSIEPRADLCDACLKNNFQILINPENRCKGSSTIDILIMIHSMPHETKVRNAIRNTWGTNCNHLNSTIRCIFLLGNSRFLSTKHYFKDELKHEVRLYNDIVQFDFLESYANLTYKTLSGLKWAATFCAAAQYVMKTDSDIFVNTNLLPNFLQQAPNTRFLGGICWGPVPPFRTKSSKFFVSFTQYPHKLYPRFCSGTGYILSGDVVRLVLQKSQNTPYLYIEDVYVGLCLNNTGIKGRTLAGFSGQRENFNSCYYKTQVITSHHMTADVLFEYWDKMQSCTATIPEKVYKEK